MSAFYVYKYFSLDGDTIKGELTRLQNFINIIVKDEIYVPSLMQLNDPFEEYINTEELGDPGILSFTTSPSNILMWSHYGNSHTGALIKFRLSENNKHILKVQYVRSKGELSRVESTLAKSSDWSYENEYRYVAQYSKSNVSFKDIGLEVDGVIFGSNCSKENRTIINEYLFVKKLKRGRVLLNDNFECQIYNYKSYENEFLENLRTKEQFSDEAITYYQSDEYYEEMQKDFEEDQRIIDDEINELKKTGEYKNKILKKREEIKKKLDIK